MENQENTVVEAEPVSLHQQKVTILSRLIKETSLTLEEALLLLKEEEQAPVITTTPLTNPGTINPWWGTTTPSTPGYGTITLRSSGNVGIGTTTPPDSTFTINGSTSNTVVNN